MNADSLRFLLSVGSVAALAIPPEVCPHVAFHRAFFIEPWLMHVQDDMLLEGYNVEDRVAAFVAECEHILNATRGNDIMITMGTDFTASSRPLPGSIPQGSGTLKFDSTQSLQHTGFTDYLLITPDTRQFSELKLLFRYADWGNCACSGNDSKRTWV